MYAGRSCGVLMMPDNNPYPQPPPVRPQPSVPPRMAARACLQTPSRMPLGFTVAQVHTSTPSISCALSSAILAGTLTCAARHTHRGCPAASSYACATSWVPGISLCRGPRCRRTSVSLSFGRSFAGLPKMIFAPFMANVVILGGEVK